MSSFWNDLFPKIDSLGYYYTYLSFYLFLIALVLPESNRFKWILLLNSITVGILGNAVYEMYDEQHNGDLRSLYPDLTEEQIVQSNFRTNLFHHTVPLAISLLLLLRAPSFTKEDFPYYLGSIVFLLVVWLLIPYQGKIGIPKCNSSYPDVGLYVIPMLVGVGSLLYYTVGNLQ